jgi:hypothetical protein
VSSNQNEFFTTARTTGIWYLALAISGLLGFMVFHPQIYDSESTQNTLKNLSEKESTARIRLILEFAIVISQALAAVWFYRLFRKINNWAAWALGVWGTVNSIVIMISAISMASAIEIANNSTLRLEDQLLTIELLYNLIKHSWGVGSLFFGLWLMPMGYVITSSKVMPLWLGQILIVGGVGYILTAIINYMGIEGEWLSYLTLPATFGEFWIIGYLLSYGLRSEKQQSRIIA